MNKRLHPLAAGILAAMVLTACSDSGSDSAATADAADPVASAPTADNAATPDAAADGAWQHPRTPWGDPDLQGMWPVVHLISVPLERREQFGDRLYFNEEEMAQQRAAVEARNTRYENEDAADRIGMGHWAEMTDLPPQTSLIVDPPNGRLPPLTPEGERLTALMGTSWGREVFDSPADFDSWDRCITRGLPPSMFPFQYNNGIQLIQAPGYVVINLEMIHEARIVPIDREQLDAEVTQWLGSSRGHWEGNTLVVETTNFGHGTSIGLTSAGVPGSPGPLQPSTDGMKITERFTRTAEDTIEFEMTIEDPAVLQRGSYKVQYPMFLDNSYDIYEYACHEGNTTVQYYIETSRFERAKAAQAGE